MFQASGVRGAIRVGVKDAIILGHWNLVRGGGPLATSHAATITASVVKSDAFWSTQNPTSVMLDMGRSKWVWKDLTVTGQDPLVIQVQGDPDVRE